MPKKAVRVRLEVHSTLVSLKRDDEQIFLWLIFGRCSTKLTGMANLWTDPARANERRQIVQLIGFFALIITGIISITTIARIRDQRQHREAQQVFDQRDTWTTTTTIAVAGNDGLLAC